MKGDSLSLADMAVRSFHQNGSISTCYGEQSEESDIRRNNERQWDILKRDVGDRLWEAIVALGVVDTEGRNSLLQGRDLKKGGRLESNYGVQ